MSRVNLAALAAFVSLAQLSAAWAADQAPSSPAGAVRKLTVDASRTQGELRSLQGLHGSPQPIFRARLSQQTNEQLKIPEQLRLEAADVSAGYRLARVDIVRTHDGLGAGDIDARFEPVTVQFEDGSELNLSERNADSIFPDPKADPGDRHSYNFGPTDKLVQSIPNIGASVLFRLGRSAGAIAVPPEDFGKYATIVQHIVMHYNQGWAGGFHDNIRYWEVWNEPDLGPVFWSGTSQQYWDLYAKLARAVKSVDSTLQVGGPALSNTNDPGAYREGFLEFARANQVPVDFFSWHWYSCDANDPSEYARLGRDVRSLLDRYGFTKTTSVLDEWNSGICGDDGKSLSRMGQASFAISALLYMQDAPIDRAIYYHGNNLFGGDGATPDKVGQGFIALGRMKDTPQRLRVSGADSNGLAVQAGRSHDERTIQVLISNYEIPPAFRGPRPNGDVMHAGPPLGDARSCPGARSSTRTMADTIWSSTTFPPDAPSASSAIGSPKRTTPPSSSSAASRRAECTSRRSFRRRQSSSSCSKPNSEILCAMRLPSGLHPRHGCSCHDRPWHQRLVLARIGRCRARAAFRERTIDVTRHARAAWQR